MFFKQMRHTCRARGKLIVSGPMDIRHADDPVLLGVYLLIIITGLVDCFFGYRAFKYALAILLGLVGAGVGAYFAYDLAAQSWTYSLIGLLLGGVLGAVLAIFFFQTAVVIFGAFFGYAMLAPLVGDLEPWAQLLILVVGCGACGFVAIGVARVAIMAATATTGAFRIIYGGWYLVGGPPILVLGKNPDAGWRLLATAQEAFIAMVVLAACGFFIQFFRERKAKKKED